MGDAFEEEECRVCRGEAVSCVDDCPAYLRKRCLMIDALLGSIRFVHSDCLTEWLAISKKDVCELCGFTFAFQPVYADDCPKTLPARELVFSVLIVALKKWVPFVIRGVLVVIAWAIVAPWCTSWLYRLWLLRAATMGTVNFQDRVQNYELVLADVFSGLVLIVVVVCSFLSLMSFADFLRFNMDNFVEEPNEEAELRHREMLVAQEMEAVELAPRLRANQENVRLIERIDGIDEWVADDSDEGESEDESDEDEEEVLPADAAGHAEVRPVDHLRGRRHPVAPAMPPLGGGFRAGLRNPLFPAPPRRLRVRQNDNLPLFDEAIQQIPHAAVFRPHVARNLRPDPRVMEANNQNNVRNNRRRRVAPVRNNNVPVENNNGAAPFPANNNEWDDDFDHMEINIAMDEVVGFRGPLYILVRNVSWFLAFNGAYLGIFAFIPYTLGSTIVATFGKFMPPIDIPTHDAVEVLSVVYRFTGMVLNSTEAAQARGDCIQFVDVLTCCIGYFAFSGTIIMWRVAVNTISTYTHRPLLAGLLWFLSCLNAVVKVGTLLMLKMIVLPVVLGVGVDFATLQLFLVSPWDRLAFAMENMLASLMIHWVMGIAFMIFITVVVLQMREVMHPDILAATIRPQEANNDLLKALLADPSIKHARRMLLSSAIYAILMALLIYTPIRLVYAVAPSLFPLQLHYYYIFAHLQVPLELFLAHMIILNTLDNYKQSFGQFQSTWITSLCLRFGLVEYLLPRVPALPGSDDEYIVLSIPPLSLNPVIEQPPANERLYGARYVPWPEDGLVDPTMIEYNLLPRQYPSHIVARVALLSFCCWWATVSCIAIATLGPLFMGRLATSMLERYVGVCHDSLSFAAGVLASWVLINGFKVCQVLLIQERDVHPQLKTQGYSLRNMNAVALLQLLTTWTVVYPVLLGLMGALLLQTNTWPSVWEMHAFGFVVLHVGAWFVCCFSLTKQPRRGRHQNAPNGGAAPAAANRDDRLEELRHAEPGVVTSLRIAYEQLCFHVTANDEGVEHTQDLTSRCFDIGQFYDNVVVPLGFAMAVCIVLPWLCSKIHSLLGWSHLSETHVFRAAFATQLLGLLVITSQSHAARWLTSLHDSIRDERQSLASSRIQLGSILMRSSADLPALRRAEPQQLQPRRPWILMSIFGNSDRFIQDAARSPGPIYHSTVESLEHSPKKGAIALRQDYAQPQPDHAGGHGQRDSWIKGQFSPSISIHDAGIHLSPSHYDADVSIIKSRFPSLSFPKSERFLSQKVCMTDKNHQRELIATDSPGPKYNVELRQYKANAPKYTFQKGHTHILKPGSPVKSHRESWLSVINRKGVLLSPPAHVSHPPPDASAIPNSLFSSQNQSEFGGRPTSTSKFGTAPRFGLRETPRRDQSTVGMQRVQYISARHARENMGEFSPGPIYTPYKPAKPGGRLAPATKLSSPSKYDEIRAPDTNLSSRSCWLSGNIRKNSGREIMLMKTGDNAPGPGAYSHSSSAFASANFSHNAKVKRKELQAQAPPRGACGGGGGGRTPRTRGVPKEPMSSSATDSTAVVPVILSPNMHADTADGTNEEEDLENALMHLVLLASDTSPAREQRLRPLGSERQNPRRTTLPAPPNPSAPHTTFPTHEACIDALVSAVGANHFRVVRVDNRRAIDEDDSSTRDDDTEKCATLQCNYDAYGTDDQEDVTIAAAAAVLLATPDAPLDKAAAVWTLPLFCPWALHITRDGASRWRVQPPSPWRAHNHELRIHDVVPLPRAIYASMPSGPWKGSLWAEFVVGQWCRGHGFDIVPSPQPRTRSGCIVLVCQHSHEHYESPMQLNCLWSVELLAVDDNNDDEADDERLWTLRKTQMDHTHGVRQSRLALGLALTEVESDHEADASPVAAR
ncbi:Aste57867_24940 [Aphanomyces stellatus]|uniref:RING-type E3 ubiquitin transferase n=1 Tax=Aphanomyces stellatus TaxID=120398 RepID=A0A485LT67_9STRA|nr:hypothetical protein As57867_024862 [Aphanomyces stellatus]VFU01571.1 Aste57867_24940 [Aphanomyces stellatus]